MQDRFRTKACFKLLLSVFFTLWIIDLSEVELSTDHAVIFLKVRRNKSALTLSQQWESLSLASEVIKNIFVVVVAAAVDCRLHKSNNRIRPLGRESV